MRFNAVSIKPKPIEQFFFLKFTFLLMAQKFDIDGWLAIKELEQKSFIFRRLTKIHKRLSEWVNVNGFLALLNFILRVLPNFGYRFSRQFSWN